MIVGDDVAVITQNDTGACRLGRIGLISEAKGEGGAGIFRLNLDNGAARSFGNVLNGCCGAGCGDRCLFRIILCGCLGLRLRSRFLNSRCCGSCRGEIVYRQIAAAESGSKTDDTGQQRGEQRIAALRNGNGLNFRFGRSGFRASLDCRLCCLFCCMYCLSRNWFLLCGFFYDNRFQRTARCAVVCGIHCSALFAFPILVFTHFKIPPYVGTVRE